MGLSVHFPADQEPDQKRKILKLQVGKKYTDIAATVRNTSSEDLRAMLGVKNYAELKPLAAKNKISINAYAFSRIYAEIGVENRRLFPGLEGTYRGESGGFFHKFFPYLEAFSPDFVRAIRDMYAPDARILLDPFGGLGTAPFTFAEDSATAVYCEVNPLMQRIAALKGELMRVPAEARVHTKSGLSALLPELAVMVGCCVPDQALEAAYANCFGRSEFFQERTFIQVLKLRTYIDQLVIADRLLGICLELATLASLVPASDMQRAGDLRRKRPVERAKISDDVFVHVSEKLRFIMNGLEDFKTQSHHPRLIVDDARLLSLIPIVSADLIVTSPPYLNGTNYFRNTKIELWFIRVLKSGQDLGRLRDKAVTAGINDVRGIRTNTRPEGCDYRSIEKCLKELDEKAYDRRIPQMIRWYAFDLANVMTGALANLKPGGIVGVDIGDSEYCGVKVQTDELVKEILKDKGCEIVDEVVVRKRKSRSGGQLKQVCIVAKKEEVTSDPRVNVLTKRFTSHGWNYFKKNLPHQQPPYAARNWGHSSHSLCSYQGKLKPAIAKFLVEAFVPEGGSLLDPFVGVGTIPFEAALGGRRSFGFDLSPAALGISRAKLSKPNLDQVEGVLQELEMAINGSTKGRRLEDWLPSFNKPLEDYYHPDTLREILCARDWFQSSSLLDSAVSLVFASTMHVLHGNRPYALSRRSHPITPFAPTGDYEYRSLIDKVRQKALKTVLADLPNEFVAGEIYGQDATAAWPLEVNELDAIITSPPFFDSTRFYLANWIRLWFAGWNVFEFEEAQKGFIDERQKTSFDCYEPIIRQARERLRPGGVLVFHLGRSKKCDMAQELKKMARSLFRHREVFTESVSHCESHGIRDKGTVTDHQYLLLS